MSSTTTFDSTKKQLQDLLRGIREGKIQLPDFQRDWVWDDDHVRGILASISLSYPIGTLMLLETGNPEVKFHPRPVSGVELESPQDPERLILDGQQRLTSLFLALVSGKPVPTREEGRKRQQPRLRWYYVDMMKALDPEADREDAVLSLRDDRRVLNFRAEVELDLSSPELEYASMMFPLSRIFDAAKWRHGFNKYWDHDPEHSELFDRFDEEVIHRFEQYPIPVIVMEKESPKDAVCQVFEKVNTGGVTLNVFELLTATYAADDFHLRDDWAERLKRLKSMDMEEPHPHSLLDDLQSTDFLQAVTLLVTRERRLAREEAGVSSAELPGITCKRKDVLRLPLEDYKRWREPVTKGFIAAAKLLNGQHLFTSRDLPYRTQLIPLAATVAVLGARAEHDGVRQKLLRWYWSGVFGERYGSAVESRFARDLPEILAWIDGGEEPETMSEASFAASRLLTLRSRGSAAYKGIYALLMRKGCVDLRTGDTIGQQTYFGEGIDIHHVFPQKWCKDQGIPRAEFDSIINKTPLSFKTNRIIGPKAPSIYLPLIQKRAAIDEDRLDGLLATHLIDPVTLRTDAFNTFFDSRQEALVGVVEEAMGKPVARGSIDAEDIEAVVELEQEEEEEVGAV